MDIYLTDLRIPRFLALKDVLTIVNTTLPLDKRIKEIYISSTSENDPSHTATSNHFRKLALDISRINNIPVKLIGAKSPINLLQDAFELAPYRRENYGLLFLHRNGVFHDPKKDHSNHIHFSVDGF